MKFLYVSNRFYIVLIIALASLVAKADAPNIQLDYNPGFDMFWCQASMLPIQDPVFPSIRQDRFQVAKDGKVVIPADWSKEADTRLAELRVAAAGRGSQLLAQAVKVVGREFSQKNFNFFFYQCPYWNGAMAQPALYPIFPYLKSAVGDLQWPDWLFTDQFLFHEVLHLYVLEKIDYSKGSPILNALYLKLVYDSSFYLEVQKHLGHAPSKSEFIEYIGYVLNHIHVYGVMKKVYFSLGEQFQYEKILNYETKNPAPHPSYVRAWSIIEGFNQNELNNLLLEIK